MCNVDVSVKESSSDYPIYFYDNNQIIKNILQDYDMTKFKNTLIKNIIE